MAATAVAATATASTSDTATTSTNAIPGKDPLPWPASIQSDACETVFPVATEASTQPTKATARPTDICWNCQECGHFAADCPQPNRCFRCNKFGHTARNCWVDLRDPSPTPSGPPASTDLPPASSETRWVFFQPPSTKTFRHTCAVCGYSTTAATTCAGGISRHKSGSSWCVGSGMKPRESELLSETHDPKFEWRMREIERFAQRARCEEERLHHGAVCNDCDE